MIIPNMMGTIKFMFQTTNQLKKHVIWRDVEDLVNVSPPLVSDPVAVALCS